MTADQNPSPYRPAVRRLVHLTNSELSLLFRRRADAIADTLDGHYWDANHFMTYSGEFIGLQNRLHEVMLEVQARYPTVGVSDDDPELLPIPKHQRGTK